METPQQVVLDLPPKRTGMRLFFGIEELEDVEKQHGGEPISSLCSEARMGLSVVITLLWAGTKTFTPRPRAEVGKELQAFLSGGGSLKEVAKKITEALQQSKAVQSLKKDAEAEGEPGEQ